MARRNERNDRAGTEPGKRPGPRGRRRPGAHRGARLGTLAALALVLPIALAAPAAGHTGPAHTGPLNTGLLHAGGGNESVAVEAPVVADGQTRQAQKTVNTGFSHRHYYSTWRDARTYWSQESRYPTGGWLWSGRHAFFCQVEGEPHSDGEGGYSTWWALTDDNTGNQDVFVSATAFRVSEPWQPVEGLPRC